MKLSFTKEEHKLFIKNHFQIVTLLTLDENNELYYVIPVKEEYTKHDCEIAKIAARKFGFVINDINYQVEDYKPENKTFCANYERDNKEVEYSYPEKPKSHTDTPECEVTLNLETAYIKSGTITGLDIDHLNYLYVEPEYKKCEDSVVEEIREKFLQRAKDGKLKYGTSMDRTDLSIEDWLEHSIQEKMDDLLYMSKIKKDIHRNIKYLIQQNSNDQQLGSLIRKLYN